jgi:hypothetical protein
VSQGSLDPDALGSQQLAGTVWIHLVTLPPLALERSA